MAFENLRKRSLTGAILAGAVLLVIFLSSVSFLGKVFLLLLGLLVVGVSCVEFAEFSSGKKEKWLNIRFVVYALITSLPALLLFVYLVSNGCDADFGCGTDRWQRLSVYIAANSIASILAVLYLIMSARNSLAEGTTVARDLFPAVFLLGWCGSSLQLYVATPSGHLGLLWVVLVVAVNDIAAYFVGSSVGGPKLALALSPSKTWSGAIAGLVAGSLVGILTWRVLGVGTIGISAKMAIPFAVVAAAQIGDLLKSFLKRVHGVKDSSNILPGHGGVLDRVDGVLFGGALFFFIYWCWAGSIAV